jgi:hypothetical protein
LSSSSFYYDILYITISTPLIVESSFSIDYLVPLDTNLKTHFI